ncbi:MAG: MMPL family transporter [Micrococcales bacterium]
MRAFISFITGRKTAWATLALGFILAGLTFTVLRAETATTSPGVGLPANTESVIVDEKLANFPGSDSTAAVIVYASETKLTDEQKTWLQGTFNPMTQMLSGGANEKFLKYTNLEIQGNKFVPPAQISEDGTTAVISVPMDKKDATDEVTTRVKDIRVLAAKGMPDGLAVYVTGPEGFQADIAGVFAGADFTLLISTVIVVALLLLITYRSPSLWLIPLLVVGTADGMSGQLARRVAGLFGITPDGSVTGILSVLVFGAGTNYALLLIARYREELLSNQDRHDAMAKALRGAGPAIIASGSTVTLALLTLSFADLAGNRALGIVCATGVVIAMIAALVFLPAALVVFGRWLFWPLVPKFGGVNKSEKGLWAKLGKGVSKHPALVSTIGIVILAGLAVGSSGIQVGLASTDRFLKTPEAVTGQLVLADAFPAGSTSPTIVIANNEHVDHVKMIAESVSGVDSVTVGDTNGSITKLSVVLDSESQSEAAYQSIRDLRTAVHALEGADAMVGGLDAQALDVKDAYAHDQMIVIPMILILVFLVLVLLLRALVAPVLLLVTVVASFFASMGAGWLIFTNLMGFPALDLSVFLYSFLFLVALGVDYNIFLVTRAKEEAEKLGTKQGMIKALSSTGGVITSAGILLAAVFAVLGVLPLVALAQIGVIVCIGVLLDTLLVRTVIVPALAFMTGKKFWLPSKKFGA